jgi:lysozyme
MEIQGIDVSTFQGNVDWTAVKNAGIHFAIIRASYGWENVEKQTDARFYQNLAGAKAAGIDCGAYHYSYATTVADARKEAAFFQRVIKGHTFEYPVAYDMEDRTQAALPRELLTDIAAAFCEAMEDAGYYVCIYTNLDWIRNHLDMDRLARYDVWLAQWNEKPTYEGNFGIWQYTSDGTVPGIRTRVDRDISYRDYPAIIKEAGLNGFEKPGPTPPPVQTYTVQLGDTMSGIAKKFGVTLAALIRANPQVQNPNLIYKGQVLNIPGNEKPTMGKYTVQNGDTMSGIGQKHGISLQALIQANPQIPDPNVIHTGQILNIPYR